MKEKLQEAQGASGREASPDFQIVVGCFLLAEYRLRSGILHPKHWVSEWLGLLAAGPPLIRKQQ